MGVLFIGCDMTTSGGGWTIIHSTDFNDGNPAGWMDNLGTPVSVQTSSVCADTYSPFLGLLAAENQPAEQSFDLMGIYHTEILVEFGYLFIDTWASDERGIVQIDGIEVWSASMGSSGGVSCTVRRGDSAENPPILASEQTAHTRNTVTVTLNSDLDEYIENESYGIDSVALMIR